MSTIYETSSLKIHVDKDNIVWFIAGEGAPKCSYKSPDRFFSEKEIINLYQTIKVVGSKDNAKLLLGLFYMKLRGEINGLQVCSPLLCPGDTRKQTPEHHLLTMRCWEGRSSSLGGWHEFDERDYYSYMLTVKTRIKEPDWFDVQDSLKNHPAWGSLSFIKHLDINKTAKLLGLIVDPRWYVDPDKPDKSSKLEAYLGLSPSTQRDVTNNNKRGNLYTRCRLVLDCWQTSAPEYNNPASFLWRIWRHHNGGWFADLRASQSFVSFLRLVWLDNLYRNRTLFVPEYFFTNKEEIEAFKKHTITQNI